MRTQIILSIEDMGWTPSAMGPVGGCIYSQALNSCKRSLITFWPPQEGSLCEGTSHRRSPSFGPWEFSAVPYDRAERKGALKYGLAKVRAMLAAESTAGHAFAKSSCQFEVRERYERASDGKHGG
jgi:hypothetical protein